MSQSGPETISVLVVDENRAIRDGLAEFLGDAGYSVDVAVDGLDALRVFERRRPAVVITALDLRRMDGRALIGQLRQHDATARILALTNSMAIDAKRHARSLGVDGYVNKPIDLAALLARVRALL